MIGSKQKILTARAADKYELYQESVQAPEADSEFLARYYRKLTGAPARLFREDFCGTAVLSCHFVRLHRENRAIAIDLDPVPLRWGREHNLAGLDEDQRRRVTLIRANVLDVRSPRTDIIAAMNFSYFVFTTRDTMSRYLRNAYLSLRRDGMLFLDAFGGSQAQEVLTEKRRQRGFTYVWEQAEFDPISHRILCKIHFQFRDGSRLRNAFVYDWRLWTLPELREILEEVGFADVHVLWEGTDRKSGRGNGVFRRVGRAPDEPAWIAYLVGRKG